MTVKIDNTEPNVFPVIEKIDARDSGRDAEVILATRIEGQLTFVTIKLSYRLDRMHAWGGGGGFLTTQVIRAVTCSPLILHCPVSNVHDFLGDLMMFLQ
jgi:hypothetical protein